MSTRRFDIELVSRRGENFLRKIGGRWNRAPQEGDQVYPVPRQHIQETVHLKSMAYGHPSVHIHGMQCDVIMYPTEFMDMMNRVGENPEHITWAPQLDERDPNHNCRMVIRGTWNFTYRGGALGMKYIGPPE